MTTKNQTTRAFVLAQELAGSILSGQREADSALPPERELAEQLDVSRPTLREALRQLEQMGLVRSRQGSGTVIQDWRKHATIDVFPIFLQQAVGSDRFFPLVESSLRVRVAPVVEAVRWLARRDHKVNFMRLRKGIADVWQYQDDPVEFIVHDFEWIKEMALVSEYYPALWVMNAFVANYITLIREVGIAAPPPEDYPDVWNQILDACKAHDADAAATQTHAYFERHDEGLLRFLGAR